MEPSVTSARIPGPYHKQAGLEPDVPSHSYTGKLMSALPFLLQKNRQEVSQTALVIKNEAFQRKKKKNQAFPGVSASDLRQGEYYANNGTALEPHRQLTCGFNT